MLEQLWWIHDQFLSMFILKKSSPSMSIHKCRLFAMLPRQQFYWGVLIATRISKLWGNWNNCSAIWMSNVLDLLPGQSNIMTALFSGENICWCFWFDALFYIHQPLCMIECQKTSICQNFYISLLLIQDSQQRRSIS